MRDGHKHMTQVSHLNGFDHRVRPETSSSLTNKDAHGDKIAFFGELEAPAFRAVSPMAQAGFVLHRQLAESGHFNLLQIVHRRPFRA